MVEPIKFFDIKETCEKYGFEYHIKECIVVLKTKFGSWMFDYTQKPYKLYHRPILMHNYFAASKTNDGYHDQKKKFYDIEELFKYIYAHDKHYLNRRKRKTRR